MAKRRNRARNLHKALPAGMSGNLAGGIRDMSSAIAQSQVESLGEQRAMPRDTFPYSFGPGVPIIPAPLDPTRRDTGRAEPRIYEYPVSWNVPGAEQRLVPWAVLRQAANISIIRDCLRIRKNEVVGLEWGVRISKRAVEAAQRKDPEAARADVERDMRDRLSPDIDRITRFWRMPDPGNGYTFHDWISQVLEEHLVLDALAIYPRFTYGGDLYGLEVLDGSTIKPLLDHRGGRPLPPMPAYQQILYGFPRGEFTADIERSDDGETTIPNGYPADQIIYQRREVRTFSPYGLSSVEQALTDADLWMKRMAWLRAEYTDGVMPSGWMRNTGETSWTPQQLAEYEREFNDYYAGITEQRHRFRILPPGIELAEGRQGADERYKPDYDLHLLKLLVAHFDMTIAELGFTEAKGLGSSGYHEGQENIQERKGVRPDLAWLADVLSDISRTHLGMPDELEFRWLGLDDEDQAAADELQRNRFSGGGSTLNEWRDEQGKPRYNFPEADMPMIVTQRGVVFLEGSSEQAPPGELVEPLQAPAPAPGAPPPEGANADPGTGQPAKSQAQQQLDDSRQQQAKKAELAAYRKWSAKGNRSRSFEWHHHSPADVDELVKAGDVDPKGPFRQEWPGWTRDLQAAKLWAGRIAAAMTGAVNPRRIADSWLSDRHKASDPAGRADAKAWLQHNGVTVSAALEAVLQSVYTDGYYIGDRSAIALLTSTDVNWHDWTPGDTEAAEAILSGDRGLATLLDQSGVTIRSIAANRLDELAAALADALESGDSADTLAATLTGILDDPGWSYLVAVTELNRAMSAATLNRYARNGISASYWLTAEDERVCDLCAANEDGSPVAINQAFPTGVYQPPAHPSCRCALAPYLADLSEVDTTGMSAADLEE